MSCQGDSLAKRCRPKFSRQRATAICFRLQNASNTGSYYLPCKDKQDKFAHVITKGKVYALNLSIDTSHVPTNNNNNILIFKCICFTLMCVALGVGGEGLSIGYDLGSQGNPV